MRTWYGWILLLALTVTLPAQTNDDARKIELRSLASRLKLQKGEINLKDGLATIKLTDAYRYIDPAGAETLLTGIWGNPPSDTKPLGMIVPEDFDPFSVQSWCVVIRYEEDGYIKDDDAEKINYNDLLKQMKEEAVEASKERAKEGYDTIELMGWAAAPRYDKQTHKFYWAKEIKFGHEKGENTLNYNLRILGRRGVLVLNAVASMGQLKQIEKSTPEILGMIDYNPGNKYTDYTPGTDKVATYGLAALVAGGIAAKAGLFKGLFIALLALKKFIIIGFIALAGFIKKIFGKKDTA